MRADQHGVDSGMGTRRMRSAAFDLDEDAIRCRHHRSRPDSELPEREAGIIVHAVLLSDMEALHQAVLYHGPAAAAALLRRLENHNCGAREIAGLGQIARGAEQHGGVPVVPAGVHLAGYGGLVWNIVGLKDGQRIHVGAQADYMAALAPASADDAHDAGAADAGDDLIASEALELVGHRASRAMDIVKNLRVRVDVAPPGGDVAVEIGDAVDDGHGSSSSRGCGMRRVVYITANRGCCGGFLLGEPSRRRAGRWIIAGKAYRYKSAVCALSRRWPRDD